MDETPEPPAGREGLPPAPPASEGRCDSQGLDSRGSSVSKFTHEVEGEHFEVHEAVNVIPGYTDTGYTWLTGPNEGYGIAVQGPGRPSLKQHRNRIRDFLATVDPATGMWEGHH